MFHRTIMRAALALLMPLALSGCLLTPGKFTATLTIDKDRSFAFAYQGEVIALDVGKEMADGMKKGGDDDHDDDDDKKTGFFKTAALLAGDDDADKKKEFDRKCREMAAALAKEAGYRKVEYVGDGKFMIDFAIRSVLTHSFIYPFNVDAEAVFPFIAIELRADGKVRVKAPGFAKDGGGSSAPGGIGDMGPPAKMDGTFTLDTDAEIVSQNNEAGAATVAGRKRVVWTVTPLSKTAPMAVLGF